MTVKMIKELGRRVGTQKQKLQMFNKEFKNIRNNQTEMRNTITAMKNTLEGISGRVNDAKEQTSELEDRAVGITATEQKKE